MKLFIKKQTEIVHKYYDDLAEKYKINDILNKEYPQEVTNTEEAKTEEKNKAFALFFYLSNNTNMSFSNIVVFPSGIIAISSLLIMTIKVFLSSSLIDLSLYFEVLSTILSYKFILVSFSTKLEPQRTILSPFYYSITIGIIFCSFLIIKTNNTDGINSRFFICLPTHL